MSAARGRLMRWGAAVAVLAVALAPVAAPASKLHKKHGAVHAGFVPTSSIGSFTPAAADPRFAASFGRAGMSSSGFRFTPSLGADGNSRHVTVAVRARASTPEQAEKTALASSTEAGRIVPYAYNLGVAVGWKRFAISSDYNKVDLGPVPGSREGGDVALSYAGHRWSTRLAFAADRSLSDVPRTLELDHGVSVDVGGSYSLTRRLDVTGGYRYRVEHDSRLSIADDRRDSQAVYVGTAFRF